MVDEKSTCDLELDCSKVKVSGSAMAMGHPIGATGSILIDNMLVELGRRDKKFGLISMCTAGGIGSPSLSSACKQQANYRQGSFGHFFCCKKSPQ